MAKTQKELEEQISKMKILDAGNALVFKKAFCPNNIELESVNFV